MAFAPTLGAAAQAFSLSSSDAASGTGGLSFGGSVPGFAGTGTSSAAGLAASVPAAAGAGVGTGGGAFGAGAPSAGLAFGGDSSSTGQGCSVLVGDAAQEIQASCRDLSSMLDECCSIVRRRDDMIRDDGTKIDEVEVKLHKFKHYYDWLDSKIKKVPSLSASSLSASAS